MGRNDRPVEMEVLYLRLPADLKALVRMYADSRLLSLNQGFRELIESHPIVAAMLDNLYRDG